MDKGKSQRVRKVLCYSSPKSVFQAGQQSLLIFNLDLTCYQINPEVELEAILSAFLYSLLDGVPCVTLLIFAGRKQSGYALS